MQSPREIFSVRGAVLIGAWRVTVPRQLSKHPIHPELPSFPKRNIATSLNRVALGSMSVEQLLDSCQSRAAWFSAFISAIR
jgi:hypothetical protein